MEKKQQCYDQKTLEHKPVKYVDQDQEHHLQHWFGVSTNVTCNVQVECLVKTTVRSLPSHSTRSFGEEIQTVGTNQVNQDPSCSRVDRVLQSQGGLASMGC